MTTAPTAAVESEIDAARAQEEQLIKTDILGFLKQNEEKELLRLCAVGSVDDGKSTLIGRLLHDSKGVYDDQLADATRTTDTGERAIDFARLTDGLRAEREQGITIDVAYRYFSTPARKFIIADTPGHVQYTRNMATGASTANVAIILIDARLGVLTQSRRHGYIADLLGIPHLLVAVNKMDLVDYNEARFDEIVAEFRAFTGQLGFTSVTFVPVSALLGINIVDPGAHRMAWYGGPTVLQFLEQVPIRRDVNLRDFRMPVQTVIRPNLDYRGFAGQVASGFVSKGDAITVLPSGRTSRIKGIDTFEGELQRAYPPQAVVLRLEDEIDISRGDVIVKSDNQPRVSRHHTAHVVWMSDTPLDPGRSWLMKHGAGYGRVTIDAIEHRVDLETLQPVSGVSELKLNDIARVRFTSHKPLPTDPYRLNRAMGALIFIDPVTNNTVGAGMIAESDRDEGKAEQDGGTEVGAAERERRLGHAPGVLWLWGGADAVRTALAFATERRLFDGNTLAVVLDDGDPRYGGGLGAQLEATARRFVDAGLVVVVGAQVPPPAPLGAVDLPLSGLPVDDLDKATAAVVGAAVQAGMVRR